MEFSTQIDSILESIFSSYFDYDQRNPNRPFYVWSKNKNARKKFKTLHLYHKQNGKCFHCEQTMYYNVAIKHPLKTSLDRVLPGSQGGGYEIENVVLSCLHCNKQRGDKSIEEYQEWKQEA